MNTFQKISVLHNFLVGCFMFLIEITYYRGIDKSNIQTAIIKESQLEDVKKYAAIHILSCKKAPAKSKRSYILR